MAAMVFSLSMSAPTGEHLSPRNAHTTSHASNTAPRYHCGAAVAVGDGEAPLERVDVGTTLRDSTVRVAVRVKVAPALSVADAGPQRML